MAAPCATGDGHRLVSVGLVGGGGGGAPLVLWGWGAVLEWGLRTRGLLWVVGAAGCGRGRGCDVGQGTPGSMKCHCFMPCPNMFHRKSWGLALLSGVWSVCPGVSWLRGCRAGRLHPLAGGWSFARCALRVTKAGRQGTCTGRWWFMFHVASPAGSVERRRRAPP